MGIRLAHNNADCDDAVDEINTEGSKAQILVLVTSLYTGSTISPWTILTTRFYMPLRLS